MPARAARGLAPGSCYPGRPRRRPCHPWPSHRPPRAVEPARQPPQQQPPRPSCRPASARTPPWRAST
eukprot:1874118-Pyramimonas_sp.AAC.1